MLTQDEARARVAIGAAYLDRVRPGWHEGIDEGTLRLESCSECIVGQLWQTGRSGLVEPMRSFDPAFGFDLTERELDGLTDSIREVAFRPLQDAWIEAIADRRLSQGQATAPTSVAVDPVVATTGR